MSLQDSLPASPSPDSSPNPSTSTPATSYSDDRGAAESNRLDLDKYIALGCISYETSRTARDGSHDDDWVEIDEGSRLPEDSITKNIAGLMSAQWIRVFLRESRPSLEHDIYRIFVLADDVSRAKVDRGSKSYQKMLSSLLPSLDVSSATWNGFFRPAAQKPFDLWATAEHCSLYYLFNKLNSPDPDVRTVSTVNQYSSMSMRSILGRGDSIYGLKTCLYPYQKRAAAMMLQKESCPQLQLDPRMEPRVCPTGQIYYYGPRDSSFRKEPVRYETVRGGILAESMGLGKSLICIALILASKGQAPSVPPHYDIKIPVRQEVGSLKHMAAATIARSPIPWRAYFDWRYNKTGDEMDDCIDALENQQPPPHYEIPPQRIRNTRHSQHVGPSEKRRLCNATIVVVPPNLVYQWQSELEKHTEEGALSVLVLKDPKDFLPPVEQLCGYDIILFSRKRFEREAQRGQSNTEDLYISPLRLVHFLRIVIDEGHGFSSASTSAGLVAEKLVRAERRWIVSGTPAKDLFGVEVEIAAMELSTSEEASLEYRHRALEQRRSYDRNEETASGAAKALGALASRFLKAQPWAANPDDFGEKRTEWDDYIYRHEHRTSRTYSSFSSCLRSTLQNLVVKTQPGDIERDLNLPPLQHKIVRLAPSAVDKMTANLFVLLYTTNAITSERKDQDYLFHKGSRAHLQRLTTNLRQSAFYWVGFDKASVLKSLEVARKYLDEPEKECSEEDRQTLLSTVEAARTPLASPVWNAITQSTEMGAFVRHWPDNLQHAWALEGCIDPMLLGVSQLISSQKHINDTGSDPGDISDLNKEGYTSNSFTPIKPVSTDDQTSGSPTKANSKNAKTKAGETSSVPTGVPSSGFTQGPAPSRIIAKGRALPSYRKRKSSSADSPHSNETQDRDASLEDFSPTKRKRVTVDDVKDQLTSTELIGTASTKLSYLIDRVLALRQEEKILIFYEGNHIAWYISQALDLFNMKHLIYSNTLSSDVRSKYLALFDTDAHHRVLVMDIKQAAHGLNLSCASRVFFVNPPNQPDVEAQAIKRAHRIGQTRPVQVETLLLKGTVEEAMFDRAQKMTKREHLAAKSLEDDTGIRQILQQAKVIPLSEEEMTGQRQMARLEAPQKLFFREEREQKGKTRLEHEIFGEDQEGSMAVEKNKTCKKKRGGADRGKTTHMSTTYPAPLQPQMELPFGGSAASSSFGLGGGHPGNPG
ncbi:MAG: hypothetical protein M1831_002302 [Alyxoria varia]|nr:MAG: hypothetical protein M1831_002302 [Alyxoria varia]